MKTLTGITALFAALALTVSCATAPRIEVNPATLTVNASGGTSTISVNSNCSWEAESNQSWVSAQKNGSGGSLVLRIDSNPFFNGREAVVTLKGEGVSATVTVNQEQKNSISVDGGPQIDVTEKAQDLSVKLKANVDYKVTVSSGANWIKYKSITKGLIESSAQFSIEANNGYESRTADVTFEAADCSVKVKINQFGNARTLGLNVAGIENFSIPFVDNDKKDAFVTVHGSQTPYKENMSVTVNPAGDAVTLSVYQMKYIQLNDIKGIRKIDVSKMF